MKMQKTNLLKNLAATVAITLTPGMFCHAAVIVPGDVSGLTLFLDSKNGVTYDGSGNVSQWNDQAADGPYNAVQATAIRQPAYSATGGGGGSPTLVFDGLGGTGTTTGSYLNANGAQNSVSDSLTLFVVFSLDTLNVDMALVDTKNVNSTNQGFYLAARAAGNMQFGFTEAGGSISRATNLSWSSIGGEAGDFFVAVVKLELNGTVTLSVGEASNSTTRSLTSIDISGAHNLRLGGNTAATSSWLLGGAISSVALYDRVLTQEEIDGVTNFMYNSYVVPEPQTAMLLLGAAMMKLIFRRRQRA